MTSGGRRGLAPLLAVLTVAAVVLAVLVATRLDVPTAVQNTVQNAVHTATSRLGLAGATPSATADPTQVDAGLVDVETTLADGQGAGTGIVLSPDGVVLTNNHVIAGARSITAVDVGDGHRYRADVVGYDRTHDVAVIRLRGASGLTTAPLGDSAGVRVGDRVTAVGNAGGQGGAPDHAPGTVTALNRSVTASDDADGTSERLTGLIAVQARIQPGDSGGPLVNAAGQVVGVDTAASSSARVQRQGGAGFAIPVDLARTTATHITDGTGGSTIHLGPTAILGIEIPSDPDPSSDSGRERGVTVAGIEPGSAAAASGLTAGDVITSVDGRPVTSPTTLSTILERHHPGDRVTVGWTDDLDGSTSGPLTLGSGPPA